jgi:predicted enzyme related to lactoylglutathione lyase
MNVNVHPAGNFCWAELHTRDSDGAKAFYTGLFGWTFNDHDMGPDGVYTMFFKGEGTVGAGYVDTQAPPHWGVYINVANVDETAEKARAAGGTVIAPPFDVMDVGRMAVLQDPTGAFFSIWQAKQHIGATVIDEPGAICWWELITNDVGAAGQFYSSVFGWTLKKDGVGGSDYTEFLNGGSSIAGMFAKRPEMGEMPSNWGIYFQVEDCDGSQARAVSLGGTSCFGPMDIPNVGRFATLADPQGAAFNILKLG